MWTAYSPSTPEIPERINTCLLISKPADRSPTPAAIEGVLWSMMPPPTRPLSSPAAPRTHPVQDLMVQLARQGVDISLRSLQLWADLARPCGLTALGSSATAALTCSRSYWRRSARSSTNSSLPSVNSHKDSSMPALPLATASAGRRTRRETTSRRYRPRGNGAFSAQHLDSSRRWIRDE
jgi:hypothetical protein